MKAIMNGPICSVQWLHLAYMVLAVLAHLFSTWGMSVGAKGEKRERVGTLTASIQPAWPQQGWSGEFGPH